MPHLPRNTIIAAVVIVLAALSIYPPEQNLRKGRDLAGGVALTYQVQAETSDDIESMIEILKKRVDPDGLYEISIIKQGTDRIEVAMPLPSAHTQGLRRAYDAAIEALVAKSLSAADMDTALGQQGDDRDRAVDRLAAGDAALLGELEELGSFADARAAAVQAVRARQRAIESGKATPESAADPAGTGPLLHPAAAVSLDALTVAAVDARAAYTKAYERVLRHSVDARALRSALDLPNTERLLDAGAGNEPVTLPGRRDEAMARIRDGLAPSLHAALDSVVEAHAAYVDKRQGLDDPADLKRLLQGAGVLSFRIAVEPGALAEEASLRRGYRDGASSTGDGVRWFEVANPDNWYNNVADRALYQLDPAAFFGRRGLIAEQRDSDGVCAVLLYDTPGARLTRAEGEWGLSKASPTRDERGMPAVGFEMNPRGATELGKLTGPHVGDQMAVLLDDQVYTAPTLQGRISRRGQITGQYTQAELDYLIQTLNAGSLTGSLSEAPISEETVSATLGADNVNRGFQASLLALAIVAVFMVCYYFWYGAVAVAALLCNTVLILGAMSLSRAAFTLPGVAGIVLTFGMAVDANVLIYERIREELAGGAKIKAAVRIAYAKVLRTIVDANITNLIVCLVLAYTATQEVKGFAITLGIGIVATLFSTLFITRLIFAWLLERFGWRQMRQLPMAVPALQSALSPRVRWLNKRPLFVTTSLVLLGASVVMLSVRGSDMLGLEFRGGIGVRFTLTGEGGQPKESDRAAIQELVHAAGDAAEDGSPVAELRDAEVIALNPKADGVTSTEFKVRASMPVRSGDAGANAEAPKDQIAAALLGRLRAEGLLDAQPALKFKGSAAPAEQAPVYPVLSSRLGTNIGREGLLTDVSAYRGGGAIVLEGLGPEAPTLAVLRQRLEQMRRKPGFSSVFGRDWDVQVIDGDSSAVRSAVVLVYDQGLDSVRDEQAWRADLVQEEWAVVREALTKPSEFASVETFSPAVASSFRNKAILAVVLSLIGIMVYVWLRFGSLRYSFAAITALLHDVLVVLGLIALAGIVYETVPGVAGFLRIEPFKIDLGLVAALLTIIGYSLNDTIVILDRIRENRGRLPYATRDVVNDSINQTFSRTLITSSTTLLAVGVMYVVGGDGIRSFTYALLCGVLVGTYSSVAVAAPMVFSQKDIARGAGGVSARSREGAQAAVALPGVPLPE